MEIPHARQSTMRFATSALSVQVQHSSYRQRAPQCSRFKLSPPCATQMSEPSAKHQWVQEEEAAPAAGPTAPPAAGSAHAWQAPAAAPEVPPPASDAPVAGLTAPGTPPYPPIAITRAPRMSLRSLTNMCAELQRRAVTLEGRLMLAEHPRQCIWMDFCN